MEKPKLTKKVRAKAFARDSEERVRANQECVSSRAYGERYLVATAEGKDHERDLHLFKILMMIGRQRDGMTGGIGAMKDMAADIQISCRC